MIGTSGSIPAPPRPRTKAPDLAVPLVGGGTWDLADQSPRNFTMVVFYRGLHCPACRGQLTRVEQRFEDLLALGVNPVAISADGRDRAEEAKQGWGLDRLPIGHDLSVPTMREWGLFVSRAADRHEPDRFNEPGLFLVKPDRELYYAAVTNMPFGRPPLDELIGGMSFVIDRAYPARGDA
ncbi:peroxiredoxin-like family protein [Streptomyces sp. NPDC047928]|uniref:peroxiredoxin-like family protein n=1 Tax=unclassified Streptomyces TaxID=2593676 RepID=UPI003711D65C